MRGQDMRLRMREAEDSGVSSRQGLGTVWFEKADYLRKAA